MRCPTETNVRPCIVIPAFNSRAVVITVITEAAKYGVPIIVVDDGSTDGTYDLLARCESIDLIRMPTNQGKGVALRAGFAHAADRGYTHALTMDSDGQHSPGCIPVLIQASRDHAKAIIIGKRELAWSGRHRKSRLLRFNSDFWVWASTGRWVHDSQSGMRVYPLRPILGLHTAACRYDFEVDVLVKAVWLGVPVRSVPIQVKYDTGCPSHFRPLIDFMWVFSLNCRLLLASMFIPIPLRRLTAQRAFYQRGWKYRWHQVSKYCLFSDAKQPSRVAAAVGIGVAFGILPIWGFQMLCAAVTAHGLRLNKLIVLAASNISFGFMAGVIIVASAWLGRVLLRGESAPLWSLPHQWSQLDDRLAEYLVGSISLAAAAGLVCGVLAYAVVWMRVRLRQKPSKTN